MEETRNFRIILHLTHFFQDHRCMCKIFVKKKMKCIADLENHIQGIFGLENFYLLSNGCFIPPTEDIRILQQDDVVVAIPKSHTNLPAYTSTPLPKITSTIPLKTKCKRKRVIIEECENGEISVSNKFEEKTRSKKKKKKSKTDICKSSLEEEYVQAENNSVDSPTINEKYQTVKNGDISNPEKNYEADVQEQRDGSIKQQESNDQNISDVGFKTSEEKIQDKLDNSVKRKVLYFEKYSDLSDPTNKSEIMEDKIVEDKNTNQECPHEIDGISEEKEKNLDFRQKKLIIQKRNTDLISYVLPKKSNIVKSIVVTNSLPDKQVNLTINIPIASSDNNAATSTKDFPQEKSNTFTSNLKQTRNIVNKQVDHFKNDELKEKPLSELICPQAKEKQIENTQRESIMEHKPSRNMQMSTATSNSQISDYGNEVDPPYGSNKNTPVEKSVTEPEEILETSMTNVINSHENKLILKGTANSFCDNLQLMQNSAENNQNDKATNSTNNTSKDFPIDIDNTSIRSERSSSLSKDFSSEKLSDHTNYFETPSFITKRKRKRSHRKRKSKVSNENEHFQLNTTAESYRRVPNVIKRHLTPAIHIKFSDDEDTCTPEEHASNGKGCIEERTQKNLLPPTEETNKNFPMEEKQSLESIEIIENCDGDTTPHVPKSINGTASVIAKTKEFNEAMKAEDVPENLDALTNCNKEQITICDDSIEEMAKAAACSTPLISEDIILKSPLMRSTKPKSRDIIAFKILRLAKDYTPELSKYIIGQVRSFNEENLNIDVNVIDGVDQCKEPDGKFSVEEP
ncbi:hypothetical protein AMK59_6761, partial [Oryctes borbonicus]